MNGEGKKWREGIVRMSPLIHCITNHIAINDCANLILAFGARPVMAEHPREMEEVTAAAQALVCNLGNISDSRMRAMEIASAVADRRGMFWLLDLVGAGCSSLRLEFARALLANRPAVIKGNISEIKAFAGEESHASGVDAGERDSLEQTPRRETARWAMDLASRWNCRVVVTGKWDLIADSQRCWFVENGCARMGRITGTGCMLDGVLASFAAANPGADLTGLLAYGTAAYGICGEQALSGAGLGTAHMRLFDMAEALEDATIERKMRACCLTREGEEAACGKKEEYEERENI